MEEKRQKVKGGGGDEDDTGTPALELRPKKTLCPNLWHTHHQVAPVSLSSSPVQLLEVELIPVHALAG